MDSEDKSNTKKWETWHRTLKRGDSSIDKKARHWLSGPRIKNTICGRVSRCPAKGPPHIRANSMKLIKPIHQGDKKAEADEQKPRPLSWPFLLLSFFFLFDEWIIFFHWLWLDSLRLILDPFEYSSQFGFYLLETFFFLFLIARGVRASLRVPQLIPEPTEHPTSSVDK